MPLDQVENFVEVNVSGTHSSTETTISLQSGEASNLPDPSSGEYNLVWFDSTNFSRPSEDSEVEIVRVTGRDTTNDTITVLRGQENTTAVNHDTANSDYVLILAQTAKMIEDVDAADFSTNSLTVANTNISLGGSGTPEADNLAGNNGTNGQVLKTNGSKTFFDTLDTGAGVSDDATQILSSPDDVNYNDGNTVLDDNDGSATVEGIATKRIIDTDESFTIDNSESVVIAEEYIVNGTVTVNGTLKVV